MNHKNDPAPSGATYPEDAAPDGAENILGAGIYNDAAPLALGILQSVTNCYRLKTGCLSITQPVTNCYQLKTPPTPGNLIPSP